MINSTSHNKIKIFWPFFSYKFIKGVFFITNITFFLFFKEKGVSYLQASFLMSLLFFLPIFFEIITGLVADTFGRKISVLISIVAEVLIVLGIIISSNYLFLIILFLLWGIATTFSSGADDSWAIESIPQEIEEDKKEKFLDYYYSASSSFFNAGMIIAGLLSSLILTLNGHNGIWIMRLALGIILIFICLFTKENFDKSAHAEEGNIIKIFIKNILSSLSHIKENKNTKNIIIGELFITISLVAIGGAILQKYLLEARLVENNWGLAYSLSAIFGIFTPFISIFLSKKFKSKKYYLLFILIIQGGIFILASILLNPIFAFLFIVVYNSSEDLFNTANSVLFQSKIPSKIRATVSSVRNTSLGLGGFLGMLGGGFLVEQFNIQTAIIIPALFLIPAIIIYGKIK